MGTKKKISREEAMKILLAIDDAAERILGNTTREEEFQDLYEDNFSPDEFAREEDRKAYIAFCRERGYELP